MQRVSRVTVVTRYVFALLISLAFYHVFSIIAMFSPPQHPFIPGLLPLSAFSDTTRAYIESWQRAFTNPQYLTTAPLGAVLAPVHAALNRIQNPADCGNGSFLVRV